MVDGRGVLSSGTEAEAVSFTDWQAGYVAQKLVAPVAPPRRSIDELTYVNSIS
jgi:hypothetical protein